MKMKPNEFREVIEIKNSLLLKQENRIKMLEERIFELRQKYFQLKYSDVINHFKIESQINKFEQGELS